jgi:hypothetical protein
VTRELALKVVDGLSEDQLAWRQAPRAHSMGWTCGTSRVALTRLLAEFLLGSTTATSAIWNM